MSTQHDWKALAQARFPGLIVGGEGRYALHSPFFAKECGKILLYETRDECVRSIYDPNHASCVDLLENA
jgi:hypothetical protein